MSRLTPEEVSRWRRDVATVSNKGWPKTDVTRALEYMLILHDEIQRLQNGPNQYMEQLDAIEREATQSDDADATLNAIVARIHRFRQSVS